LREPANQEQPALSGKLSRDYLAEAKKDRVVLLFALYSYSLLMLLLPLPLMLEAAFEEGAKARVGA
jgi:ABC-type sulfate transport system permease subunit